MVAHLSSKLSHLAQSFRPQHHFNTLRNAFPSSAHGGSTTGFFDPANVFQQANNSLGAAAGQAAGAGTGSSAGGAGGAKWHAGRNAHNWGFSNSGRMVSQAAPTSQDANSDDADDSAVRRRNVLLSRHRQPAPSRFAETRNRRRSLSSSDRRELLAVDEVGLRAPRLSSSEMQMRYRSAFAEGQKTREVRAMELEADEMDLGDRVSTVRTSGRRASISSGSSTPRIGTTSSIRSQLISSPASSSAISTVASARRDVHTSAATRSPFPSTTPPQASVPRVRRNSTSAVESSTPASDTSSPPLADSADAALRVTHTRGPRRQSSRPPTSDPSDAASQKFVGHQYTPHPGGQTVASLRSAGDRDYRTAQEAVRRYVAVESSYSVDGHNAAMEALLKTRYPNTPITTIVHLYNQLFEHESLRPNRRSYEIVLRAFCDRDYEVLDNINFLNKRLERKKATKLARGPYHRGSQTEDTTMNDAEVQTLETLNKEDYLSPALEIYKTLGPLGDKLDQSVVSVLLRGAARRGRIDVALSLFGRLEKSPFQRPLAGAYQALVQMFGCEKDKDSLMDVFEGYLQARADGLTVTTRPSKQGQFQRVPTKHAYSTTPEYTSRATSTFFTPGDDAIWRNTIAALFEAGDSAEAIALLERMLLAQNSPDPLPAGYPRNFGPDMLATIVAGFASLGDEASARKWFDQAGALSSTETGVPRELHTIAFYAALRANLPTLVRHIYMATLDRASPNFAISISEFVTFVDHQITSIYAPSTSEQDRRAAIDALGAGRTKFNQAVRNGWTVGDLNRDFDLSTGLLSRIVVALAHSGEWDAASSTYVDLGRSIIRSQRSNDSVRTPEKWASIGRDVAMVVSGMEASNESGWKTRSDAQTPPVAAITKIVAMLNRIGRRAGWDEVPTALHSVVADSFLIGKAALKGDVEALGLTGEQWYTVIDAFAHVQSQIRRGLEPSFDFPGFEPIIDDFAASQVKIPSELSGNFPSLVKALLAGGMSSDRARAVLAVLDLNLAQDLQAGKEAADAAAAAAAPAPEPVVASPSAASSSMPDSLASDGTAAAPVTLPTPPATPPPYVIEQSPAPMPTVEAIDVALTSQIDQLVFNQKIDDAFRTATQGADQRCYAHPDALGRLVEALGREGKLDAARQAYVLAYASLPALAAHPTEQSMAWTVLEDHMIVALAQAGSLEEVGYHRDRLIQAGSAPSADGYAAMILNMKETTNDAAVALSLFEESQRYGVKPNVYLFNTLISKLSRARRAKDALEYFELMKSHGLRPSAITYGSVINACCKTGDDASADYLFQEMVATPKFKPRVPPYNTMIQFYTSTKPDRARALHYYRQLLDARVQPTGHTYKLLLDAYGSIPEPDFTSMEDVFSTLLNDKAVAVTGAHWGSVIHAYGSVGKDLERAMQVFDSIPNHPSTRQSRADLPDAVVYEALLNAFLANGRADLCENYLVEMKERGVRMTAYVANTLIKGHAAQKNMSSARAVFDAMEDPPSGVAAAGNHTVDRHPKHQQQQPRGASASQQGGTAAAMGPVYREPSTWETMIKAELDAGEAQRALALMKRVEERAFPEAVVARIRKHLDEAGIVSLI